VAANASNVIYQFERAETIDRQAGPDCGLHRGPARNVQPASRDVGVNIVPVSFTTGPDRLEHFVRSTSWRMLSQADRHSEDDRDRRSCSKSIHTALLGEESIRIVLLMPSSLTPSDVEGAGSGDIKPTLH